MDEEERNYCSLALLLLRVGNPCLRLYFKTQWNAAGRYTPWTDCAQNGADLLRMFKPLPYEKNTVKSGDTSQWDLSLFVKALLQSRPPFVVAPNLVTALQTLKEMRNKLCHSPIPRVKAADFQTSWTDGCNALSLFGATVVDFDKVKQDVQKPWSELLPMMKQFCADQDKAILDGLDIINSKLEQLQQGQDSIAEAQSKLQQGQDSIAEGQSKLQRGQDTIAEGQSKLQRGQDTIAEGQSKLQRGQDTIVDNQAKLQQGQDSVAEGQSKLQQGHDKILKELSLLKQDERRNLASHAKEYTEKLKSSIKKQTDFLLVEEEDKKIRTDDIFTNVTIQRGQKQFKKRGPEERRYSRRQMDEVQPNRTALKTCSEMFVCQGNDDKKSTASSATNPKSILLTGKAGIGKSLFCRKLVRDWSHDQLFEDGQEFEKAKVPDFQFVFLLTFRQLLPEKKQLNLRDILNRSSLLDEHAVINEQLLQYVIENPEKLVIILDGYDEYKHREKITGDFETRYPNDPHEKLPVPALIAKIMKGKMLKESVVVVSSRPGEAEELKKIVFDVRCDIQGFSSPQVLRYIGKYFKENESMKKKVLDHIKTNDILLSFGHIPVMCFLMCYCIKWYMTESKTTDKLPVTRTELYNEVITLFIKKHSSSKYEEMEETKVQEILHKLAELAVNLMIEGKYIFDENYMKKFKFNQIEITNLKASGLLDCCPGVKKSPSEKPPLEYTFTHLNIHEYLCAYSFVEKKEIPKKNSSAVTLEFVAGILSTKKDEKLMEELIENIKPENKYDKRNKLLTLSCLYEYKDDGFSTRVINNLKHIYCSEDGGIVFSVITDIGCLYISYLLYIVNLINAEQTKQHLTSTQSFIVNALSIGMSSFSASGIRMLCNSLVSISTVTELMLYDCGLDDECVEIISNVLSRTNITDLNLSYNNTITNVGLQCLCSVLKSGDCCVKVLDLHGNYKITVECVQWARQQIPDVKLEI